MHLLVDSSQVIPQISVCVPAYNGYPHISTLVETLLASPREDFEVIVADDCSSDQTWAYLERASASDRRLRCFRNASNLGMDQNFARSVSLAAGQYVWLCGQDDKIFHQGIDAVIECIEANTEIDFIYLNHIKVHEGETFKGTDPVISGSHVYGKGLGEFLLHHEYELPTFLPKYIIRRSLWDAVDVARYFGTCYCQVGVFLESSRDMKWCHLGGVYVVGFEPVAGWQVKPLAYTRIILGFFIMLHRAANHCGWVTRTVVAKLYQNHLKQLIYSFILMRSNNLKIDRSLLDELAVALRPYPDISRYANVLTKMPQLFCSVALWLIQLRRLVRK